MSKKVSVQSPIQPSKSIMLSPSAAATVGTTFAELSAADLDAASRYPSMPRVLQLISRREYGRAIDVLNTLPKSEMTSNALAVCYLRAGAVEAALGVLRSLSLNPGTTVVKRDAHPAVIRNFATALLLKGLPSGALDALIAANDLTSPRALQIRGAIDRWARSLPLLRRLDWKLNRVEPKDAQVPLDFPVGEFVFSSPTPSSS